mmetsp:Transcript_139003/g.241738  ORF Transcript_139003/g.241738 Transcript_139003/m.241738 type:complete len:201 (+) Transcript_139003:2328-2930(+)
MFHDFTGGPGHTRPLDGWYGTDRSPAGPLLTPTPPDAMHRSGPPDGAVGHAWYHALYHTAARPKAPPGVPWHGPLVEDPLGFPPAVPCTRGSAIPPLDPKVWSGRHPWQDPRVAGILPSLMQTRPMPSRRWSRVGGVSCSGGRNPAATPINTTVDRTCLPTTPLPQSLPRGTPAAPTQSKSCLEPPAESRAHQCEPVHTV